MSGWIKVEDKLPQPRKRVLCYVEEGRVDFGSYETGEEFLSDYSELVTHWMPVPEGPK